MAVTANPETVAWWKQFWAEDCEPAELEAALESGVDPNWVDPESGNTPLFDVLKDVHLMLVLLKAGANPNVINHHGETPLTFCADWGREEEASCLLHYGADPDLGPEAPPSWPALFYAAHWGRRECVQLLVGAGANPNYVIDGRSALYFACEHGHVGVAEYLLTVSSAEAIKAARAAAPALVARVDALARAIAPAKRSSTPKAKAADSRRRSPAKRRPAPRKRKRR